MRYGKSRSVALHGLQGHVVEIEVQVQNGLPKVRLVGLPDASLGEARDRCRAAIVNSGQKWPDREVTIALSPASLPKTGSQYDLPIALAVVASAEEVPADEVARTVAFGELALDGRLRAVHGVLPAAMAAVEAGCRRIIVPDGQVAEASAAGCVEVIGVRSLRAALAFLRGEPVPDDDPPVPPPDPIGLVAWHGSGRVEGLDMRDVVGQHAARVAMLVAAAGGHHVLLSGPPGVGKTMLAERLPGLLPDLGVEHALEVTAVHSVAGLLPDSPEGRTLLVRPPFVDPHHSTSKAAVVGGGTRVIRPGAMSLAHRGVLFMDEAPEFARDVLEALRQPLEKGSVNVRRVSGEVDYPARFQLVLAANPCPCGQASVHDDCSCSPQARRRYTERISGPIRDRIDIQRTVVASGVTSLTRPDPDTPDTLTLAAHVVRARARQRARYADDPWSLNVDVPGSVLRARWPLDPAGEHWLDHVAGPKRLGPRSVDRICRLAWTVTDLLGLDRPDLETVQAAEALRGDGPLPGRLLALVGP